MNFRRFAAAACAVLLSLVSHLAVDASEPQLISHPAPGGLFGNRRLIIPPRTLKFPVRKRRRTGLGGSAETSLVVGNSSGSNVLAYVTWASPLVAQNMQYSIPVTFTPYNQAMCTLTNGQTMAISNPSSGDFLSGTVGFIGTAEQPPFFPTTCPDIVHYANGCNIGEFTLNASPNQETTDVSCVEGVNTVINVSLSGGPAWTDSVTSITNNTSLSGVQPEGVYPAGCDACTQSLNPPKCSGSSDINCPNGEPCCPTSSSCWNGFATSCSTTKCQLNRAGSGGTVTITCQSLATSWDDSEKNDEISMR